MPPLSDKLLNSGCALHVDLVHGEPIRILSGADAGKTFYGVIETLSDIELSTELGEDRRKHRMVRFRDSAGMPNIGSQDVLQTEDGQTWTAVRNPGDGFLTTDYELKEIADCDT